MSCSYQETKHTHSDTYVSSESGTGVVHQAPGFGEDDLRVAVRYGIVLKGESVVCPVDYSGRFTDEVTDFKGQYVKVGGCHVIHCKRDILNHVIIMCLDYKIM